MDKNSKIYVAGHRGLVGSALLRALEAQGHTNLVYRTHQELDLVDPQAVKTFFEEENPEYVLLAAAKVGGIHANDTYRGEFIYQNLQIQSNVIHQSYLSGVKKLLFLGSSCIYPTLCPQPIKEEYLLSGPLEPTNDAYAIAKIAGIMMCQSYNKQYGTNFISAMPTNLYGVNDNFHPENSHVLPALIRRFHEAKEQNRSMVDIWGSGTPRREFLHSDDLAQACLFLMNTYSSSEVINIGSGEDQTIKELVQMVVDVVGYQGSIQFDRSKKDGTPKKLLDVTRIKDLGWSPKIELGQGLKHVYQWYLKQAQ